MVPFRLLDLFSGIGGFSLGLERTGGFKTVAFCEIDPFCRRVLAKHWPEVPCYDDIRALTAERLAADGIAVDAICGGFPCQDLSTAGNQAGMGEGTRSGLWSEIDRLVGELRPKFLIVENVANLLRGPSDQPGQWFGRVLGDLACRGYDAEWENIPASAVGAPHRRERVWLVAYPDGSGHYRTEKPRVHSKTDGEGLANYIGNGSGPDNVADARGVDEQGIFARVAEAQRWAEQGERSARSSGHGFGWWFAEPRLGRVANGVPDRAHRLKGLGNAVVPQIPELIGNAILAAHRQERAAA